MLISEGLSWNLTLFGNSCPEVKVPGYQPPPDGNACQDTPGEGLGIGALLAYVASSHFNLVMSADLSTASAFLPSSRVPRTHSLLSLRNMTLAHAAGQGCHHHRRRSLQQVYSASGLEANPFISQLDVFIEFSLSHPAIRIVLELSNPFDELGLVISQLVFPIFNSNSPSQMPATMGFLATPIVLAPGATIQSTLKVRVTDPDVIHAKPSPTLDIRHGSFTMQLGEMRPSATGGAAVVGANSLKIVQFFSLEDMTRTNQKGHC